MTKKISNDKEIATEQEFPVLPLNTFQYNKNAKPEDEDSFDSMQKRREIWRRKQPELKTWEAWEERQEEQNRFWLTQEREAAKKKKFWQDVDAAMKLPIWAWVLIISFMLILASFIASYTSFWIGFLLVLAVVVPLWIVRFIKARRLAKIDESALMEVL